MTIDDLSSQLDPKVAHLIEKSGIGADRLMAVQTLAMAIDKALDDHSVILFGEDGRYGTSVKETSLSKLECYGAWANICSAVFALWALKNDRPLPVWIHKGWAWSIVNCGDLRDPQEREKRLPLTAEPFEWLSAEEQSKDEAAVDAVLGWTENVATQAIIDWITR